MRIGLLGYGTVGSGVGEIINNNKNLGIDIARILVKDAGEATQDNMTTDFQDILNDESIDTVVECIGGVDVPYNFCAAAIKKGKNIVTSNKAMLAYHYQELIEEAKNNKVKILFEASVGGGIPWIYNLCLAKTISPILSFSGIMNGTTNYILDKMFKEDCSFEQALKEAQAKGYAEKDPTSDIEGYDTRNKVCISANVAWDKCIDPEKILCSGISKISKQEIEYCKSHNATCRLIGEGYIDDGKYGLLVLPQFINTDTQLGATSLNNNTIELVNETLCSMSFSGQGAGKLPTAHAVIQDLLLIKDDNAYSTTINQSGSQDDTQINQQFYIRSKNTNVFKEVTQDKVSDEVIITKIINTETLFKLIEKTNDEKLFVAGVNYD